MYIIIHNTTRCLIFSIRLSYVRIFLEYQFHEKTTFNNETHNTFFMYVMYMVIGLLNLYFLVNFIVMETCPDDIITSESSVYKTSILTKAKK